MTTERIVNNQIADLVAEIDRLKSENERLKADRELLNENGIERNEPKIGDGKYTITDLAKLHVDTCYEPSSDFDRNCMIRCVEVGYNAYAINLENQDIRTYKSEQAEREWMKGKLIEYIAKTDFPNLDPESAKSYATQIFRLERIKFIIESKKQTP